jgi:hypothetical protein
VKNWNFGASANGTIRSRADLETEFQFHDQFKTIANGTNYGAVTVASCRETAIGASGLGLPSDDQPIEDEAEPTREWTGDTMLSHVRPLSKSQETVSAARHDAGNGSLMAKWSLPSSGALLGRDMVWETRVRMPKPLPGFWFALWTAGDRWSKGAEMYVVESFGTPNINFDAFHSDSVGGTNTIEYKAWPDALDKVGVPDEQRELSDWHTWTWVYNKLPASMFPLTYEIDYSRVYLR